MYGSTSTPFLVRHSLACAIYQGYSLSNFFKFFAYSAYIVLSLFSLTADVFNLTSIFVVISLILESPSLYLLVFLFRPTPVEVFSILHVLLFGS